MSVDPFVAKFLQAMDGRYDVNNDRELDLLMREMQRQGYHVGRSRDEVARTRALLRATANRPDYVQNTTGRAPVEHHARQPVDGGSVYSIALEKQIGLLRWFDEGGHNLFDDMLNPGLAGFADAARCRKDCRSSLDHGDTYYFAPHLLPAIEAAAETMPDWTFADHMAPYNGFFWYGRHLRLPFWSGEEAPLAAISWNYAVLNGTPARNFFFWVEARNECAPVCCYTWVSGEWRSQVLATRAKRFFGVTEEERTTEAEVESEQRDDAKLRILSACIAFIDQRIFQSVIREASRAVRRRNAALKHEPLIRVIELRRTRPTGEHHEAGEQREWSCQWIVRGHWRQQWYPKLGRHQPKWITPYVKGPEDRPLKQPRATVFAVVR